jgi:hypothetical protein
MVTVFSNLAVNDLGYSIIAQEIILNIAQRFSNHKNSSLIQVELDSLVKKSLDLLLDLEPLTRA